LSASSVIDDAYGDGGVMHTLATTTLRRIAVDAT